MGGSETVMSSPEIIHSVPVALNKNRAETKGMGLKTGDKKSHVSVQTEPGENSCSVWRAERYRGMQEKDTAQSGHSFYALS